MMAWIGRASNPLSEHRAERVYVEDAAGAAVHEALPKAVPSIDIAHPSRVAPIVGHRASPTRSGPVLG
jgi:hypothetical protein